MQLKRNELSYIQPSYASLNCNSLPLFLKLHLLLMMFAILLLLLPELFTPFIVKPPGRIWMYNHFSCVMACTNGKYRVAHELCVYSLHKGLLQFMYCNSRAHYIVQFPQVEILFSWWVLQKKWKALLFEGCIDLLLCKACG
jgi:hypothetical protein